MGLQIPWKMSGELANKKSCKLRFALNKKGNTLFKVNQVLVYISHHKSKR